MNVVRLPPDDVICLCVVAQRPVTVVRLWRVVPKWNEAPTCAVVPLSCDAKHRLQSPSAHNAIRSEVVAVRRRSRNNSLSPTTVQCNREQPYSALSPKPPL